MKKPSPRQREFITFLNARVQKEDRAALAALRRGLGKAPGTVAEMHQYVARWLPRVDDSFAPWQQRDQDAYYLVAALFGLHQQDAWSETIDSRALNLGWSVARLKNPDDGGSIEHRFTALLNSNADDLPAHLRHIVSLLKAHEAPVNWAQLLVDIQSWPDDDRSVQRAWAQAFWGGRRLQIDDESAEIHDAVSSEQPAENA